MKILRNLGAEEGGSPSPEDAMSADSSTANQNGQQGDKAPKTLNEHLVEQGLIKKSEDSDPAKSDDQSSEIQKMNETAEAKDKVDAEKKKDDKKELTEKEELGQETEVESEEDKAKRLKNEEKLNNNPRFQEVIAERNEVKEQVKTLEPKAQWCDDVHNFMRQNQVTLEQYQSAVKFAALCNIDPEAALKEIKPLVEKLEGFTGNKLPVDLQEKVDSGKMELADAKEFASLRSKLEFGSKKFEHERKSLEQQERERTTNEMANAARSWQDAKQKTDPDYKPKTKPSDEDGKFEEVRDKYIALLNRTELDANGNVIYSNPVRTSADMTSLMEKAYQAVNGFVKKSAGQKPLTRKTLSSNGSSTINGSRITDPAKAKTMQEAMQIGLENSLARQ